MFFSLWKSLLSLEEKQLYDCRVCLIKGKDKERYCFLYDDNISIPLPSNIYLDEERGMPIIEDIIPREVTSEQLLDGVFSEFCNLNPDAPPFQLLQEFKAVCNWKKELCVTGLFEESYLYLLDLYETCKMYKTLPLAGGVEDQTPKVMEIFKVLESESIRFEKIRSESKDKK